MARFISIRNTILAVYFPMISSMLVHIFAIIGPLRIDSIGI